MSSSSRALAEAESHLVALSSGQWCELEHRIAQFENAWQSGAAPALEDFLPPPSPIRAAVLCELAATDLEWRWHKGQIVTVESYLSEHQWIDADPQLVLELAVSEFVARRRAGLSVDVGEFSRRFPEHLTTLRSRLAQLTRTAPADSSRNAGTQPTSNSRAAATAEVDCATSTPAARATDEINSVEISRRVGRYGLLRPLGTGSFGAVYEAVDTELGRHVAIKLPRNSLDLRQEERARFLREARNLARISHPAIVPVLDAGSYEGTFYIVFSLVDGPTLADWLSRGPIPPRTAARIIATIADALDCAHRQGIVHRDVKPTNILFDGNGQPWLTNFGLASRGGTEATLTREGDVLGTPAYMAPEQARGATHRADGRSDIYSLGAVLYECLTGQRPFVGSTTAVLDQIRTCEPLPPARLCRHLDHDLQVICLKTLEKLPADRFASAGEMAEDLRRYLADEPIRARPPGPVRRLIKWAHRKPAVAALAGVTLATGLLVLLLVWSHNLELRTALTQTDVARNRAEALRLASEQSRRQAEDLLYAADLRLALNSIVNGDRGEAATRLGKYLPSADSTDRREFGWFRLWGQCRVKPRAFVGHQGDVYAVQVIDGGRQFVSAGRDRTLRLWDVDDPGRTQVLATCDDEPNFVVVGPNGNTLATGSDDGIIRLFNLPAARQTRSYVGHGKWALCGAISPAGNQLATSGRDHVIRLWSIPEGALVGELSGHTSTVESLAYLPEGQLLISAGSDRSLRIWDLATRQGETIWLHPAAVNSVACSHDGRQLATACSDYRIYLWDVASRSMTGQLRNHLESVQSIAFSPDDRRLASCSVDGSVRIWEVSRNTQTDSFVAGDGRVWNVAWAPDGQGVASAHADGVIRYWRLGDDSPDRAWSLPVELTRIVFSKSSGRVWVQGKQRLIWTLAANEPPVPHPAGLTQLACALDAGTIVGIGREDQLQMVDPVGGGNVSSHVLPIRTARLAISPRGDLVAVAGFDGELLLYELPDFRLRWSQSYGAAARTNCLEFTRRGDELVVASSDNAVRVHDVLLGTARVVCQPPGLDGVVVSPDGRYLATNCRDRAIRIWDRQLPREVACLRGHDAPFDALAIAPDSRTLAAGTSAGTVTLWHTASWQELGTFSTSLSKVRALAFSPDGTALAMCGGTPDNRGQLIIWRITAHE